MKRQILAERKSVYYLGTTLMLVGVMLFGWTVVKFALHFGDFSDFEAIARASMTRAIAGSACLVVGSLLRFIGSRGLARSGVILGTESARSDRGESSPDQIVKIRCRNCSKLNAEDSKFCQECGEAI